MIKPEVTDRERPKNGPCLSLGSLTSSARAISSSFISSLRLTKWFQSESTAVINSQLVAGTKKYHHKVVYLKSFLKLIFEFFQNSQTSKSFFFWKIRSIQWGKKYRSLSQPGKQKFRKNIWMSFPGSDKKSKIEKFLLRFGLVLLLYLTYEWHPVFIIYELWLADQWELSIFNKVKGVLV